ncbi:hypothetical protein [Romboutsia sp.]|uniref:hypothetical protein n=1 Tax=Romboutsia sp. TaxID=1965302 RepID=UPI003F2D7B0C
MIVEHKTIHDFDKKEKYTTTVFNVGSKLDKHQEEVIIDLINVFVDINDKESHKEIKRRNELLEDLLIINMISKNEKN